MQIQSTDPFSTSAAATAPGASTSAASSTSASAASAAAGPAPPSESMFLQLLVAQLKYQDPSTPQDPTQFVGELAQFSQLEQTIGIKTDTGTIVQDLTPAATTPPAAKTTTPGS